MKVLLASVVVSLLLSGCGKQTNGVDAIPPTSTPPVVDTSTPDKAVKSLWAAIDWRSAVYRASLARNQTSADELTWKKLQSQLSVPAIANEEKVAGQFDQYSRDILQATVETESRAVVIAHIKNSTPLPAEAALSKYEQDARQKGLRIKYVLEKAGSGWQISEAWEWDDFGSGFRKSRPAERPYYPTHVFGGW